MVTGVMRRGIQGRGIWARACPLAALLAFAPPALAQQGSGGLVISSLPSDVVIGAAPGPAVVAGAAAPPAQFLESAALAPVDAALASAPAAMRRPGMPMPSIIVGDLAILAAIGPRGPLGLSFALREAIRQRDAALFERLLGQGMFDPDPDRMAEAIQAELQRAECYGGRIDGQWGAGSTRAVERWRAAADVRIAGDAPQSQLFRAIARSGDLRCAAVVAPVAAAPVAPRGGGGGSGAAKPNRPKGVQATAAKPAKPAKPAQSAKPAKPAASSPQFNPSLMGSGMFR